MTSALLNDCLNLIPFTSPALKKNSCDVDYDLLGKRIAAVAIVCIGIGVVPLLMPSLFSAIPLTGLLSLIASPVVIICGVPLLDWHLSEIAANVKAVNQYLTQPHPSKSATSRIQYNFSAAKLLVSKQGDLNKLNTEGEHLLNYTPDPKIFKLLVRHGANIKAVDQHGVSFLRRAAEETNAAYLRYLLKTHQITPQNLSANEQVDLWVNIGSGQAGHLLRQYGFNPNIRDDRGYTPLLTVVKRPYRYSTGGLCSGAHVNVLLQCGADKFMTVVDSDGVTKNAMQLSTDRTISQLLA